MKSPQPLGRVARRPGKNRKGAPPPAVPLKVFIAYADLPAVRGASGAIGQAMRDAHRNVELHPMLWRFQQLESSHWRDRAIGAALDADIIVLTSSTPRAMSPALESWVDAFLAANRGRRATIVAIFGPTDAWTISIEQSVADASAAHVASVPAKPAAKPVAKRPEPNQRLVA